MPTLLCTLGTSPAIVLEAIFTDGFENPFKNVLCITTEGNEQSVESIRQELQKGDYNDIHFHVEVVPGFKALNDQSDHERFQEALYDFTSGTGLPTRMKSHTYA